VWFQKISIPPPQRATGNFEGGGVLKAKIFKGKYEPKLEFPEEVGAQTKKSPMGGVLIFSGTAHCLTSSKDVCIGCHLFSRATKYLVERNTSFIENSFRYTFS